MTRFDLIKAVEDAIQLSHRDAQQVVLTLFKAMEDALKNGDTIELRGLGTFGVKMRKASIGRNVRTGAVVNVTTHPKVFFRLGRDLKKGPGQAAPVAPPAAPPAPSTPPAPAA
jgi:integration host factor subunit beta